MVGRGDDHRVDVGPCDQLAAIARRLHLFAGNLLRPREPALVGIGDGDDFDPGQRPAARAASANPCAPAPASASRVRGPGPP